MIRLTICTYCIFAACYLFAVVPGTLIVKKPLKCEYFNRDECKSSTGPDGCDYKVEECEELDADKPMHCFVLWHHDNATGAVELKMKGCFSHNAMCNQTECINNEAELRKNLSFCCCNEDMCNKEHRWVPLPAKTTDRAPIDVQQEPPSSPAVTVCLLLVTSALIMGAVVGYLYYAHRRKSRQFNELPTRDPEVAGSTQCLPNLQINLDKEIAHGRFGTVWIAKLNDAVVAVKIFPMQDKQSWVTEQEVFKLPRMRHANILEYLNAGKRLEKDQLSQLCIITAYHRHGSLCDYLKEHTVTWLELCRIAESMARGLMHLHEEIPATKLEQLKPAIAHRDFKSKNVLLKADLTACIADFGLALVFQPGKPCGDTHGQVGTRRYMAPEVLEGAINFTRDAFLRIDVYACGLVLWELVSRCTAHGGNVPKYALPFEAELGSHPTLDEMQENVVMKKLRPTISNQWRSNANLSALCDTMEECWDHDAEARLSSSCIQERVAQLGRHQQTQLLIESNAPLDMH